MTIDRGERFPRFRRRRRLQPRPRPRPRPEPEPEPRPPEPAPPPEQRPPAPQHEEINQMRQLRRQTTGQLFPEERQIFHDQAIEALKRERDMGMPGRAGLSDEQLEQMAQKEIAQAEAMMGTQGRYGLRPEQLRRLEEAAKVNDNGEAAWAVIDELLCEIFDPADADIAQPLQLDYESSVKRTELFRAVNNIGGEKGQRLTQKTSLMNSLRQLTHNAVYLMESGQGKPEDMHKFMQQSSDLMDLMFNTDGVGSAYRFYEKTLKQMQARGGNWIDPEKLMFRVPHGTRVAGGGIGETEWDIKTRLLFIKALKEGEIGIPGQNYFDNQDRFDEARFNRDWPEWKIRRALSLGKAFGMISTRFVQISASTRLPDAGLMTSPKYEYFVRPFNPVEHLLRKFGGYGPAVSLFYYMITGTERIFKSTEEAYKAFAALKDDPKMHDVMAACNLFEAYSPTSSGWRNYLSAREFTSDEDRHKLGLQANLAILKEEKDQLIRQNPSQEGQIEQTTKDKMRQAWLAAIKRQPLLIMRLLTEADETGRDFMKYQKIINQRAFGQTEIPIEELDAIEDELFILEEKAVRDRSLELDFNLIRDPHRREQARTYSQAIQDVVTSPDTKLVVYESEKPNEKPKQKEVTLLDALLNNKEISKRSPYSMECSDFALEDMEFSKTGHIGWLARFWNDYKDFADATTALGNFMFKIPTTTGYREMAELLQSMFVPLQDVHRSTGVAAIKKFMDGLIRASKRTHSLPWPYELYLKAQEKPESYMQNLFGRNALVLDKIGQRNLVKHIRWHGMIESGDSKYFYDKFKLHRKNTFVESVSRYGLLALALWLYSISKWMSEQLKEEAKEAG